LRSFRDCGPDILLVQEAADVDLALDVKAGAYRSALNVAIGYNWDVGIHSFAGQTIRSADGIDFLIAPGPARGAAWGQEISSGFWHGDPPPDWPSGGFRFARIPVGVRPEQVLNRLELLR